MVENLVRDPFASLDYFPDEFLTVIDESHVTIPQIRAMYGGDRVEKKTWLNMVLDFHQQWIIDH